jgi:hypothetical protein
MEASVLKDNHIYIGLLILLIFSLIHILHPEGILESYKKNRKILEKLSPSGHKLTIIFIRALGVLVLLICIILFIQYGLLSGNKH